ncbi:hypothetical protein [Brevundimonas sp.]|uniref:hypothetical protein n=1 Tax=Brevundimonas sp. TaxID=1871086 RepID=UPI001A1F6155|nr:hypothetical protein [Brevundimonas sp.]MBJ7483942.1 hypothetical protein [Brevundimonas sp.]
MKLILILTAASSTLSGPVSAQQPWELASTVEQAVARALADAMVHSRYGQPTWAGFGVHGGRDVYWHLVGPTSDSPGPVTRRIGWLAVGGKTGSVAVCGDATEIRAVTISVGDLWLASDDAMMEAIAARAMTTDLVISVEFPAVQEGDDRNGYYGNLLRERPAYREWRVTRPEYAPAVLTAQRACTPPGTRSAPQCSMTWKLYRRPDYSRDTRLPAEDCPIGGRGREVSLD